MDFIEKAAALIAVLLFLLGCGFGFLIRDAVGRVRAALSELPPPPVPSKRPGDNSPTRKIDYPRVPGEATTRVLVEPAATGGAWATGDQMARVLGDPPVRLYRNHRKFR